MDGFGFSLGGVGVNLCLVNAIDGMCLGIAAE
jgi:hypothetical protein